MLQQDGDGCISMPVANDAERMFASANVVSKHPACQLHRRPGQFLKRNASGQALTQIGMGSVKFTRMVFLLVTFLWLPTTDLAAQLASRVNVPMLSAPGLDQFPASKAGGPITSKFVDPLMTTRQFAQIFEFLNKPCEFDWNAATTVRDIHRDLARHLSIEIDFHSLEEIGVDVDQAIYPELASKSFPVTSSSKTVTRDPFADDLQSAIKGDHVQSVIKVGSSEANQPSSRQTSSNQWWRSGHIDESKQGRASNGARLFHFLDRLDLSVNVRLGQLSITTYECAERGCVRVFDVTPLVDIREAGEVTGLHRFGSPDHDKFRDYQSLIDVIQTSIDPDTWEALGGPSTIAPFSTPRRCCLVVCAPLVQQWKIGALLERLNE